MSGVAATIERLAFRAWPAAEEALHAGWVLRRSPGMRSRRINSATSPLGDVADVGGIEHVIATWYRVRDASPVVRMLSVTADPFDRYFSDVGWVDESPTAVMTKGLGPGGSPLRAVAIRSTPTDRWLAAKQRMTAMTDDTMAAWTARAAAIPGWTAFAAAEAGGDIVATGLGVVEDGWLGIFDVHTVPELRRRGLATAIVRALEATAIDRGAASAYLQVERRNVSARALYAREGYEDRYRYWYRRPPR